MSQRGIVISIDFELDWGYSIDKEPLETSEVLEGLNKLINLFEKHQVKTTWAIVGKLFENGKDNSKRQSNWILKNLIDNKLVEIGSHTYSHIFCEEVPIDVFEKDLTIMNGIYDSNKIRFKSIIFPRNQFNDDNIKELKNNNYTHFRSVLDKWYLKTDKFSNEITIKRYLIRFFELIPLKRDVLINNFGGLISVSDSRFLRFFTTNIFGKIITPIYLRILKFEMKKSIKRGGLYHIWFHPHNIIKKPNGFKQLDMFLTYYNERLRTEKSISSYKLSEIYN
jgi:hypothetical protein